MKGELRPNIEVLIRLAEAFSENNSMKKTHVQFATRTSWDSFDRYLKWLINKSYVECISDKKDTTYRITESGREMFNMILKLKEHVRAQKQSPLS